MLRLLSSVMLALVLALTSQSMAVARGASAATGKVVLCTGAGLVAVYTDAQGKPTSAPHICPDAALNVLTDVPDVMARAPWTLITRGPYLPTVVGQSPTLHAPKPQPRAPPLDV